MLIRCLVLLLRLLLGFPVADREESLRPWLDVRFSGL
jgi:hypothetical protein